ncbi:hypothetical protein [Anaerococcus cruorum]|uniref:Uncharacterized protein n=1 Tax=Anaerococcus cruorum TaxID=3115617 RepID=A0ABW9MWE9_9FIRM
MDKTINSKLAIDEFRRYTKEFLEVNDLDLIQVNAKNKVIEVSGEEKEYLGVELKILDNENNLSVDEALDYTFELQNQILFFKNNYNFKYKGYLLTDEIK